MKFTWNRGCRVSHARAGVIVCGVVVGNQMHLEVFWRLGIDPAQELEPLMVAVSRHALANHLVASHVERSKLCGGVLPFVVMRHDAAMAFLEPQAELCGSSAWIWLFSSTENTSALSGGSR